VSTSKDQRSMHTSTDGTALAVDSRGTGPGLLVLSGAVIPPGGYKKLVNALAPAFTVHYLHRRGRGASGTQGSPYRVDREYEDIQTVLAATGTRMVFGHSFGGLLALRAALYDGDRRISRIVAYEPAASIDGSQPSQYLPTFTQAVERQQYARALTQLQRSLHVGGPVDRLPPSLGRAVNWAVLASIGRGMRHTLHTVPSEAGEAIRLDGPASDYAGISSPTMLMLGQRAPEWLRDTGTAIASRLPHAQLKVLPGLDHNGPLLKPAPVAQATTEFLLHGATNSAT